MKLRRLVIVASFLFGAFPLVGAAQVVPDLPLAETHSAPASKARATFGTTRTSSLRIGSTEFVPLDSTLTYSDRSIAGLGFSRFATSMGGDSAFAATAHLPSGALVTDVEFDGCDSSAGSDISFQVQSSTYAGEDRSLVAAAATSGSGGCGFSIATLSTPFQVDNEENQLTLIAFLPTTDGLTSISGAIVHYHLQVSPAPAFATFPDVLSGDPGFQYVEALAASGVTGGCGGGLFCPDSFVTRRQMAIFLAKALGLQFP